MTYIPSPTRYDAMPYRRCGKSGLLLPALSLGLWHNFGGITPFETQQAILRTARLETPPRRAGDFHQSGLRHVAGAIRQLGQPEIPDFQP